MSHLIWVLVPRQSLCKSCQPLSCSLQTFLFVCLRQDLTRGSDQTGSCYVDEAGLELSPACLSLPSAGFKGVPQHAWLPWSLSYRKTVITHTPLQSLWVCVCSCGPVLATAWTLRSEDDSLGPHIGDSHFVLTGWPVSFYRCYCLCLVISLTMLGFYMVLRT